MAEEADSKFHLKPKLVDVSFGSSTHKYLLPDGAVIKEASVHDEEEKHPSNFKERKSFQPKSRKNLFGSKKDNSNLSFSTPNDLLSIDASSKSSRSFLPDKKQSSFKKRLQ